MAPFPLALSQLLGHWGQYVVYFLIGMGFGAVLEMAGFGNSRKLAAQFYFTDLSVLKVMFGAIIVAMVLIFGASAIGLLDYNLVWVNHTYLWPAILGGLIIGIGFIIGGFCPGTSLVSAVTGKVDGIFFVLGVLFGIFAFGETVDLYSAFFHSSYMGRFTLMDWLNLPTGVIVLFIVLMALFMFWGAEQLERIFGKKDPSQEPKWRYGAAGGIVALAVAVLLIGQPTPADRWNAIAEEAEAQLAARAYQIHPGELLDLMHDPLTRVIMLDVRSETDYNTFHIIDARHAPLKTLPKTISQLLSQPPNTVIVVMSNDEAAATEAWKMLVSQSVPNVYILGGGVNGWIDTFADEEFRATHAIADAPDDALRYWFEAALGARHPAAEPDPHKFDLDYETKVQLQIRRGPVGGGCGS